MNLTLVCATPFEITPLQSFLELNYQKEGDNIYVNDNHQVKLLITGVGINHTAYALGRYFAVSKLDLAINAGIAGAISTNLKIGEVVNIISEDFGDLGVEQADGSFTSIHDLGLIEPNVFPFEKGRMYNHVGSEFSFLKNVSGISVQKIHGSTPQIEALKKRTKGEVESMEGAAFFYACLMEKIPFLEIRSISNYVEARNKENWNIPLAIEKLNKTLIDLITTLP